MDYYPLELTTLPLPTINDAWPDSFRTESGVGDSLRQRCIRLSG